MIPSPGRGSARCSRAAHCPGLRAAVARAVVVVVGPHAVALRCTALHVLNAALAGGVRMDAVPRGGARAPEPAPQGDWRRSPGRCSRRSGRCAERRVGCAARHSMAILLRLARDRAAAVHVRQRWIATGLTARARGTLRRRDAQPARGARGFRRDRAPRRAGSAARAATPPGALGSILAGWVLGRASPVVVASRRTACVSWPRSSIPGFRLRRLPGSAAWHGVPWRVLPGRSPRGARDPARAAGRPVRERPGGGSRPGFCLRADPRWFRSRSSQRRLGAGAFRGRRGGGRAHGRGTRLRESLDRPRGGHGRRRWSTSARTPPAPARSPPRPASPVLASLRDAVTLAIAPVLAALHPWCGALR